MKVLAITGGAEGIGRATALHFARNGYAVSIMDPNKPAGMEIIQLIRKEGGKAQYVPGDAGSEKDIDKWLKLTLDEFDRLDVLINNAGIGMNGPVLDLPLSSFDRVIQVGLRGTFYCSQQAAKIMERLGGGAIVNISSTRALMSEENTEAYSASKGGILALTHAMAVSLGPFGIRVNAISPGWIETSEWKYSPNASSPNHSDADRLQHPVGRVGTPMDIAAACLFLAEDTSSFITGQNLVIDGGMTIKMIYV
ncbi:SDR family NAD(P)-dependent oxidoreductase [Marinicrinis lubricantis]|uniref:SDR family NAD(P)-dependent oxidoreductase n=1 Tax=Marinicrinis lubricantis TaxID=2086470 RepID=A0ABW1ITB4_9BACL